MAEPLQAKFNHLIQYTKALQEGHFKLASGLHGSRFFRCIKLLEIPQEAGFLFDEMARRFLGSADVVLGANEAGSILAFETAKRLQVKVAIARPSHLQPTCQYHLIDGFTLSPQQRILVVDDITTTGGTAKQLINIVKASGAIPIGVGLIATKGLFQIDLGCPVEVLFTLEGMDAIAPDDCPLCQQGIPLTE